MNAIGLILIIALGIFVTWLTIDTIIYIVKKVKLKKQSKDNKEGQDTSN